MVSIYWKTFFGSTVRCNAMFISRILSCSDQMRIAVNASVQLIAVSHHNEPRLGSWHELLKNQDEPKPQPAHKRGEKYLPFKPPVHPKSPRGRDHPQSPCECQRDGSEVAQKRSPRRTCDGPRSDAVAHPQGRT